MHGKKRICCALMAGALTVSAFAVSGCRKKEETKSTKKDSSVTVSSEATAESTTTVPTATPTPTPVPMDPTEKAAKELASELGVKEENLRGQYDLFLRYADIVVNNPKLGHYKAYALDMFPVVADHLNKENEDFFLEKLADLKIEDRILSGNAGEFNDMGDLIFIYGDGEFYESEALYTTIHHELTHFLDAFIDGAQPESPIYDGEKIRYPEDYQDEWQSSFTACNTSFITEGGAELYMAKYFSKQPDAYYGMTDFLIGYEWIFGSEALDDLFFSADSSKKFVEVLKNAGYSDEKIASVMTSFNYLTYGNISGFNYDRPEHIDRFEDVLIDLYEYKNGKDKDWKQDKVFCQILKQSDYFFNLLDLEHKELRDLIDSGDDPWVFTDKVMNEVDQKNNPGQIEFMTIILLDGKPYLTAGLARPEEINHSIPTAILVDYDFDNGKINSYEYLVHDFPKKLPEPLSQGAELDARLASLPKDNSAAHKQTALNDTSDNKKLQDLYDRATALGNKYGVYICLKETIPSYVTCGDQSDCDLDLISQALDQVEKALALFPEGYFDQFNYGSYCGFEIDLASWPLYDNLTCYPVEEGYILSISLDCKNSKMVEMTGHNLINAIFEATDLRLKSYYENFENPVFCEENWKTYNPDNCCYIGYANGDFEHELYESNKSYFVSFEAMNRPVSDRSLLMTALLEGKELTPECRKKAEFFSTCIREAFDDSTWPEKTTWEEAMAKQG